MMVDVADFVSSVVGSRINLGVPVSVLDIQESVQILVSSMVSIRNGVSSRVVDEWMGVILDRNGYLMGMTMVMISIPHVSIPIRVAPMVVIVMVRQSRRHCQKRGKYYHCAVHGEAGRESRKVEFSCEWTVV